MSTLLIIFNFAIFNFPLDLPVGGLGTPSGHSIFKLKFSNFINPVKKRASNPDKMRVLALNGANC